MKRTLIELLHTTSKLNPNSIAVRGNDYNYTYYEFENATSEQMT